MIRRQLSIGALLLVPCLLATLPKVYAVPILQLYVEGGQYDPVSETWVLFADQQSDRSVNFRLWVIGNPNPRGPIYNVRVSVAYDATLRSGGNDLAITWTPSVTGGLGGFFDPSLPPPVSFVQTGAPGTRPTIVGNARLPWHGVFGPGTVWQEFRLGDFTLRDSPLGDFIYHFPYPGTTLGQINVYDVSIRHTGGMSLIDYRFHFDAYGYVLRNSRKQPVFAPFSHDAQVNAVPVPSTLALSLATLGALGSWYFKPRRGKRVKGGSSKE